jgi:small subunit ribosomal protein S6
MYQLLYILPAIYTEDELKKAISKVDGVLGEAGAKNVESADLGKVKLAYKIKKHGNGSYILSKFSAETADMKDINRAMKLENSVLRYAIGKDTDSKFKLSEFKIVEPGERVRERKEKEFVRGVAPSTAAKEKEKVAIADLDEKLDSLLAKEIV